VTAFYASRKPPGTIGAAKKHVIPYRKYGSPKPQPNRASISSKQQRELVEVASLANNLLAKMKGK
jgi:hypothetical protein